MIKPLSFLLLAVTFIFSSCSKDSNGPSYEINSESVTINYDQEFQFEIAGDPQEVKWSSSDERVGSIDQKGLFSAARIGSTTITAKFGSTSITSEVVVEPYDEFFIEPLSDFSLTPDAIKSKETRSLMVETEEGIMYEGENTHIRRVMYTLKSGKFASAFALFVNTETMIEKVAKYYMERYDFLGTDDEYLVFRNGTGAVIGISVNENLGLNAIYVPETSAEAVSVRRNIGNDLSLTEAIKRFKKVAGTSVNPK